MLSVLVVYVDIFGLFILLQLTVVSVFSCLFCFKNDTKSSEGVVRKITVKKNLNFKLSVIISGSAVRNTLQLTFSVLSGDKMIKTKKKKLWQKSPSVKLK